MSKKQEKEVISKRQARKEELRRKERQQRVIVLVVIATVALVIIGFIIVPTVQNVLKPGGDFIKITPMAYSTAQGTSLGNPDAKVKVMVFEDYKCSACKNYTQAVEPQIIKELAETGRIHYTFYQYPFLDDRAQVKDSDHSASASLCAADQGKFWDYKGILFANQNLTSGEFSSERLIAFADSLSMDMNEFKSCLQQNPHQQRIDEEIVLGEQMGITGTPTIFVNGKNVSPEKVPTYEMIQQAVAEAETGTLSTPAP